MTGGRDEIVRYRLEHARETMVEAEQLAAIGHWNGCVNRLYYVWSLRLAWHGAIVAA